MITYLEGKLVEEEPTHIVVENSGVGYFIHIPLSSYKKLAKSSSGVKVYTHLHVREDAIQLYGFATPQERHLFRLIISVSGVGPKLAQSVLSGISVEQFRQCMAQGDLIPLMAIPGVGQKTAQRLLVDLREKFATSKTAVDVASALGGGVESTLETNAIKALVSLGCRRQEAERLVHTARKGISGEITLEELILRALQHT